MGERNTKYYNIQMEKAQNYFKRYLDELRLHFDLNDFQIIKILEMEIKKLKAKHMTSIWEFIKKI